MFSQDEAAPADKQYKQEPAQVTYSTSAVSSTQEVLYINGNGTYSYHSYRGLGGGLLNLNDASSSGEFPYKMCLCVYVVMCTFPPAVQKATPRGTISIGYYQIMNRNTILQTATAEQNTCSLYASLSSFSFKGLIHKRVRLNLKSLAKLSKKCQVRSSVNFHDFMRTYPVIIVLSYTDHKMRPLVFLWLEFENTELHIL